MIASAAVRASDDMARTTFALLLVPLGLLCGCSAIGASTVARDRFDYGTAITESWKRQALLNIVKLRYLDPPVFVDVGQIVAGYTLETAVAAGAAASGDPAGAAVGGLSGSLGGSARFTDRPTITYTPLTGNRFVRALMTPLDPNGVFSTIAAGWPADQVLRVAVTTLNGLDNLRTTPGGPIEPDPRFLRVAHLMRDIQRSGSISMRVRRQGEAGAGTLLVIRTDPAPEVAAMAAEMRTLLRLDPNAREFQLAFGAAAQDATELAVVTRSVLHIMQAMAAGVDVPETDVAEGRAVPGLPPGADSGRLIAIRSSASAPDDAFVAVHYRDRWFWIDDRDLASKRALSFMMMLFTLSDPAGDEKGPTLTIPI
jgi:hypothetical protein